MVLITEGNVMQLFLKFSPKSGTFVSREGFTCGLFHNRPNVYILFTCYGFESYIMTLSYFACHELDTRRLSTLYHWPFQISNIFVCFKRKNSLHYPSSLEFIAFCSHIYLCVFFLTRNVAIKYIWETFKGGNTNKVITFPSLNFIGFNY